MQPADVPAVGDACAASLTATAMTMTGSLTRTLTARWENTPHTLN